jgi:hypothetical protein
MNIDDILPADGFPVSGWRTNCHTYWMPWSDSEKAFRERGHPRYGERDIVYSFNSRGFRGPEFEEDAQIRMASIGCSWVFGHAVPAEHTFHEMFAARLRDQTGMSVVNWNLGVCGASNDYVARMLHQTVDRLNPDIVLVMFTQFARREHFTAHGTIMNYSPSMVPWDPASKEIMEHFGALSSRPDDQLNFFRNYKSVENLLAGRCWLFSFTNHAEVGKIKPHIALNRYAGEFKVIDRARDHAHPGPETHGDIAELFWTKFVETDDVARLAEGSARTMDRGKVVHPLGRPKPAGTRPLVR